jgi:hypothetical protein
MAIDGDQPLGDIKGAVSPVPKRDTDPIRGFSDRQVRALAQQAALVEAGTGLVLPLPGPSQTTPRNHAGATRSRGYVLMWL